MSVVFVVWVGAWFNIAMKEFVGRQMDVVMQGQSRSLADQQRIQQQNFDANNQPWNQRSAAQ